MGRKKGIVFAIIVAVLILGANLLITNNQRMQKYNDIVEKMEYAYEDLSSSLHGFMKGQDTTLSNLVEDYAHYFLTYIEFESSFRNLHESGRYPEKHLSYGYEYDDLRSAFFDLRDLYFDCILDEVFGNDGEIQPEWIDTLTEIDASFELAMTKITFREYLNF